MTERRRTRTMTDLYVNRQVAFDVSRKLVRPVVVHLIAIRLPLIAKQIKVYR